MTDLAWLNAAMLGEWTIVRWLRRAVRSQNRPALRCLLDVGCGDGSVLRAMASWAHRVGLRFDLVGIDVNAAAIEVARARTPPDAGITFQTADVFAFAPQYRVDFVVSSLLAHHLNGAEIASLLRWMHDTATAGWLIYDLQRSAIPYHAVGLIGRIARVHPMVVQDGRLSVRRALSRTEWIERIYTAGLPCSDVRIAWFFYRLLVSSLHKPCAW